MRSAPGRSPRHAVFVAFHFPPEASSSGVLRTLKYVRYLPEHGWRTTVLTVRESAYRTVDPRLEEQVPRDTRVIRTRYLNVKRHLSILGRYPATLGTPDVWNGWLPFAVRAGRQALTQDPPSLIYSTSPFATAHLVAGRLASRFRIPWVVDFRDPWYEEVPEPGTPRLVQALQRRLERRVVARASRVTASTESLTGLLRERYPEQPPAKFVTILNGYDEADFTALPPVAANGSDRMLLLHAGGIDRRFRDPRPLFAALRRAADLGKLDLAAVRFRFLGVRTLGNAPEVREALDAARLRECVEFAPRVPHGEALAQIAGADLLVLLQASPDTESLVPAKLFEYLRAGRPVLALVHPGAAAEVLRTTGGGWVADPRSEGSLVDALAAAFAAWRAGTLRSLAADPAALSGFDRRRLTGALAAMFDTLVTPGGDDRADP